MTMSPSLTDTLAQGGVRLEIADHVATVTLVRPDKLNAQTPTMWVALAAVGRSLPADVRVVVLRGEGRSFSAGLNLGLAAPDGVPGEESMPELMTRSDQEIADTIGGWQEGMTWLRRPDIVSIAVVQGNAIGAGFQLALSCDLRVAADDARFCMKEPALGLVPDLTGTQPLLQLVGYSRALEICATARFVLADEAERIGLVNVVVPRDQLDAAVSDLVSALLAHPHPAVTGTKQLLQEAASRTLDEQRRAECTTQLPLIRAVFGATH